MNTMNDDRPPSPEGSPDSWLRRVGRSLTGAPRNKEEITEWLAEAAQHEVIDADALQMMRGVLDTADTPVEDIMIPRSQMVVVKIDDAPQDILRTVVESGHSRFPVIGENRDQIIGILLAKDLLKLTGMALTSEDGSVFDLRQYLRPPMFVPEIKRLNMLLKDFRSGRHHMAIVIDEYGGVAGLVTIEDVLETIVGDIDDEHDESESAPIVRQDNERYLVTGLATIEEFNSYFGTKFSDEDADTVGGLVTQELSRVPRRGESVVIDDFDFKVLRADSRRVHLLQVRVMASLPTPPTPH
ncbi:MAG: transporter associated domain-containing protein [Oceanococcaceae bacterium]